MMPERGSSVWRWLPTIIWAILIFIACSIPSPTGPKKIPFLDKAAHLILFAVLTLLLARSLFYTRAWKKIILLAIGVSFFFGLIIELYQILIPYRSFEYLDLVADGIGAGFGGLLWLKFKGRKI